MEGHTVEQNSLAVCKFYIGDQTATGFFFNLPVKGKMMKSVASVEHKITTDMIKNKATVKVEYPINQKNAAGELERRTFDLKLDESERTIVARKEEDIIFIELKPEEIEKAAYFLDVDFKCQISKDGVICYKDQAISIYHHPKGGPLKINSGKVVAIDKNGYNFGHSCETAQGSAGAPLILEESQMIIGIHYGKNKTQGYNLGSFIKRALNEINKK